jgi:hypothetical protein
MKKFNFVLVMLALVLVFGLAFVSCDNGGGNGGDGVDNPGNGSTPGGDNPGNGNTPGTSSISGTYYGTDDFMGPLTITFTGNTWSFVSIMLGGEIGNGTFTVEGNIINCYVIYDAFENDVGTIWPLTIIDSNTIRDRETIYKKQ